VEGKDEGGSFISEGGGAKEGEWEKKKVGEGRLQLATYRGLDWSSGGGGW